MAAGAATSSIGGTASARGDTPAATELTSPTHVAKKRKTFIAPTLTAFEVVQAAFALLLRTTSGVQAENVTPIPLSSMGVLPSTAGENSVSELILQASVIAAVSCTMSPPMPTAAVTVTTSPVRRCLPCTLFMRRLVLEGLLLAMLGGGGSNSGIVDDGDSLGDDLYLPTIIWDPNVRDKCYQPQWKIAESSRLIFPLVVQHWVERAYPLAETAYVESLNNENLMNSTMVDSVSQPRRLAEIRRRWMHDNNELHQAWATIQELKDEKYRLESQLQAAGLRESRFLSEKNKAEDDLKRVTAHLAEERLIWARDIAEKDRVLAHAKSVQEELERKAITEAQKVRSEMSAQERYQALTVEVEASNAKARAKQVELEEREEHLRELQHHCDFLISERNTLAQSSVARLKEVESALEQANVEVDNLTSQLAALRCDRNWLITNGLVGAFEYLRQSAPFTALIDRLSATAY
ncbi:hypothetical protein Hanom_Chr01g00015121 [Helianthus anomalus]